MFKFCQHSINTIKLVYVTVKEMEQTRNNIAYRFSIATTVPWTRSFHQIVPLSISIVSMKQASDDDDDDSAFEFDFF